MSSEQRIEPTHIVKSIRESWHAPGYRDPELFLETDKGVIHVRLSPQAFVELHNMVCPQQACIDDNGHRPLDFDQYPWNTTHVAQLRRALPSAATPTVKGRWDL